MVQRRWVVAAGSVLAFGQGIRSQTAFRVVQTNDDGWAVANIRAQFNELTEAGYDVVLSAPAQDMSGTGSKDAAPTTVGKSGCQFLSCPAGSPSIGNDTDNPRLNYVNSYPVTAVRHGFQDLAPSFFNGSKPDLVVSGPNVGLNTGGAVPSSATIGAACEAAKNGIPAIAFSGAGGSHVSFTTLNESRDSTTTAEVFAALGVRFLDALLSNTLSTDVILPSLTILTVNYADASKSSEEDCTSANNYAFALTRVNNAGSGDQQDVATCNRTRLPTAEALIAQNEGRCVASVSVMNASTKSDVDADTQAIVLNRLEGLLSCIEVSPAPRRLASCLEVGLGWQALIVCVVSVIFFQ